LSAPAGDGATVSVSVRVPPADAFDIFTREIDLWWRRGPQFRIAGRQPGRLGFEERSGGRLFETVELDVGPRVFVIGTILVWEPPARLAFEWRGVNFAAHESTRVDVDFRAVGESTLVTVRHSGFASLRDGHPARHGLAGPAVSRMIGLWWRDLLTGLREHADGGSAQAADRSRRSST
jgi:uncharacterized protein YndB with AHSA1/START domain